MTITREQVADLQPGDVVELRCGDWHPDVVIAGPVRHDMGRVQIGPLTLYWPKAGRDGEMYASSLMEKATLTVVSRAPRPLYVNHPRTEPAPGDYARDEDADGIRLILRTRGERFPDKWIDQDGCERTYDHIPARRLRLLVDGETGLPPAVQS